MSDNLSFRELIARAKEEAEGRFDELDVPAPGRYKLRIDRTNFVRTAKGPQIVVNFTVVDGKPHDASITESQVGTGGALWYRLTGTGAVYAIRFLERFGLAADVEETDLQKLSGVVFQADLRITQGTEGRQFINADNIETDEPSAPPPTTPF